MAIDQQPPHRTDADGTTTTTTLRISHNAHCTSRCALRTEARQADGHTMPWWRVATALTGQDPGFHIVLRLHPSELATAYILLLLTHTHALDRLNVHGTLHTTSSTEYFAQAQDVCPKARAPVTACAGSDRKHCIVLLTGSRRQECRPQVTYNVCGTRAKSPSRGTQCKVGNWMNCHRPNSALIPSLLSCTSWHDALLSIFSEYKQRCWGDSANRTRPQLLMGFW